MWMKKKSDHNSRRHPHIKSGERGTEVLGEPSRAGRMEEHNNHEETSVSRPTGKSPEGQTGHSVTAQKSSNMASGALLGFLFC